MAQTDSIKVKVTKVRTENDITHYWMKDIETGTKYYTVCNCPERKKRIKGEVVAIAKPDLIFDSKPRFQK